MLANPLAEVYSTRSERHDGRGRKSPSGDCLFLWAEQVNNITDVRRCRGRSWYNIFNAVRYGNIGFPHAGSESDMMEGRVGGNDHPAMNHWLRRRPFGPPAVNFWTDTRLCTRGPIMSKAAYWKQSGFLFKRRVTSVLTYRSHVIQ